MAAWKIFFGESVVAASVYGNMGTAMTTDGSKSDEWLAAARLGDEEALARLFEHNRRRLERAVELRMDRRLHGRVDAADVVQETYLAVRHKFAQYIASAGLSFFLWLRLEVGQKLIDIHRQHLGAKMRDAGLEVSLSRGVLPGVTSAALAEQLLGRLTTASHAAMRGELKIRIQEALNSMDDYDREVLVLRHFEELSNCEAAQVLGISPTAACNRYARAIRRLKNVLVALPGGIEGIGP
jgi:RNA polymerase sigma-70 factor (ECF subfamily)